MSDPNIMVGWISQHDWERRVETARALATASVMGADTERRDLVSWWKAVATAIGKTPEDLGMR